MSEKIITAAQLSGADKVIRSLPQGYETIDGKWFEEGEELSIGQWQKIALAFQRDAQILILDEPTSALDAKAEFEIFKQFPRIKFFESSKEKLYPRNGILCIFFE